MDQPFFVVGFQRSGTTLLRLMLDSHPAIAIPLDTVGLWARYEARLSEYNNLKTDADVRRLIGDLLAEERIRLWEVALDVDGVMALCRGRTMGDVIGAFGAAYARAKGKLYWGDKDPGNMTRIDQLNRWFPGCRIIHIIRDGRDACLSHLEQDFGHNDVLACAVSWREEVEWVRRIGRILGAARYLELRYEDLIANPERTLQLVSGFLGVEYSPRMLEYHTRTDQAIPSSKRHIWRLIGEPPQAGNAARWKREMRPGLRVCFEKRAGSMLEAAGYEVLKNPGGAYWEEFRNFSSQAWYALRSRFGNGRKRSRKP